jgi:ABC-type lipoprotein export system ATPase subunit
VTAPDFELRGVWKSFPVADRAVPILRNLDLDIHRGEYVALVGPSGSGKSTLLNLLGCLDIPTAGRLCLQGADVGALPDDDLSALRNRCIGFVFQRFHLLPSYDAVANVALGLAYSGRPDRWDRSRALLESLGLGHRLHHRPYMLSGGEQQRVAIARAISNDPQIILADEPTGALDRANGNAVLDILEGFHREGRTVIIVTHDADVAGRAHRVVEMVDGEIRDDRRQR